MAARYNRRFFAVWIIAIVAYAVQAFSIPQPLFAQDGVRADSADQEEVPALRAQKDGESLQEEMRCQLTGIRNGATIEMTERKRAEEAFSQVDTSTQYGRNLLAFARAASNCDPVPVSDSICETYEVVSYAYADEECRTLFRYRDQRFDPARVLSESLPTSGTMTDDELIEGVLVSLLYLTIEPPLMAGTELYGPTDPRLESSIPTLRKIFLRTVGPIGIMFTVYEMYQVTEYLVSEATYSTQLKKEDEELIRESAFNLQKIAELRDRNRYLDLEGANTARQFWGSIGQPEAYYPQDPDARREFEENEKRNLDRLLVEARHRSAERERNEEQIATLSRKNLEMLSKSLAERGFYDDVTDDPNPGRSDPEPPKSEPPESEPPKREDQPVLRLDPPVTRCEDPACVEMAAMARQQKYENQLATCERRYGHDASGGDPGDPTLPHDSEARSACNSETATRIIEESARIIRIVPNTGEQFEDRQNEMVAEEDIQRHLANQDGACKNLPDSCACRQWNKDYAYFLNRRYGDLWIMDGMQAQISQDMILLQNAMPKTEAEEHVSPPPSAYEVNAQICSDEKEQKKIFKQLAMRAGKETEEEFLERIEEEEQACLRMRDFINSLPADDKWRYAGIPEMTPMDFSEVMAGFPNLSFDSCQ
jgi:hypothetical protein